MSKKSEIKGGIIGKKPLTSGALFYPPQEMVTFGPGSVRQLAGAIDGMGKKRALVVTGAPIVENTDLLDRVKEVLGERMVGVSTNITPNVPRPDVLDAASLAREVNADILVSLGGGSPIDGAKAIALCLSEGVTSLEQLDSYRQKPMQGQPMPHIALPTTIAAAEYTCIFGMTDLVRRIKDIYVGIPLIPKVVILDPELTIATPAWLWASTGMKAMDHALERLCSPAHQPFTDALCIQALRYLFKNLPLCLKEPNNIEVRLNCQLAACMSIFGFVTVRAGINHAIGHQLGGHCNVPHGYTSSIMLPHSMEFNLPAAAEQLALAADAAGIDTRKLSTQKAAEAAIKAVRKLVTDLELPARLRDVGVKESDFPLLAKAVMVEAPLMQNPRPVEKIDDVIEILRKAW